MYIHEEIIIDKSTLPRKLQDFIVEMEEAYKKDDYSTYLLTQEVFEPAVKQYLMNGRLPRSLALDLIAKYS